MMYGELPRRVHAHMMFERLLAGSDFSYEEITGKSRKKTVVLERHRLMAWMRTYGYSYPELADVFKRDHSTVIYALKKYKSLLELHGVKRKEPCWK